MRVQIVGAGLAGVSAAITLAEKGVPCNVFTVQPPERAQSVLAAGGINGALNTMGENDSWTEHMHDTLQAGLFLADPEAVQGMTREAPEIIRKLQRLGVPFNQKDGEIIQRNFGGQKKKRTAFSRTSTGKMIMNALIDTMRRYEARDLIHTYTHHEFAGLLQSQDGNCVGLMIRNLYADVSGSEAFYGPVIMAVGGLNGLFPGRTTGSTANTGAAAVRLFAEGVTFSNLEMIQYHPTTFGISGKRCLVSEAARGEGGRLFILRNGKPWYFMDEKYPELGSLMPRDVVSREMYFAVHDDSCEDQVYLDMRKLSSETWNSKLSDLRSEIQEYLGLDPAKDPVPIAPGIHYFMGGIDVDLHHETNIAHLYAAGECCSQYHGANRLGGNSMLGAVYGGMKAAESAAICYDTVKNMESATELSSQTASADFESFTNTGSIQIQIGDILEKALGIVREQQTLAEGLQQLNQLKTSAKEPGAQSWILFAEAMVRSALAREERRGAHYRQDCPVTEEIPRKTTAFYDGEVHVNV